MSRTGMPAWSTLRTTTRRMAGVLSTLTSTLTAAVVMGFAAPAHAEVEVQWWHSMGGALGLVLSLIHI